MAPTGNDSYNEVDSRLLYRLEPDKRHQAVMRITQSSETTANFWSAHYIRPGARVRRRADVEVPLLSGGGASGQPL